MYTIARIHSEIFEQLKLLPPNTVLVIEFDRHKSDFLLLTKHSNRNYILKMESFELLTRLVDMDEEITAEIDSVSISGRSMFYSVCRVKMMYYSCGTNIVCKVLLLAIRWRLFLLFSALLLLLQLCQRFLLLWLCI